MEHEKIDLVINRYYSYLPNGNDFFDSVSDLKFEYKEQIEILRFLEDESILINWGNHGKHILSRKGKEIKETYGGIEKYLEDKKKENEDFIRIEKIKKEKLINDAKIAKWQVKTFWYVFIFGLIGGIYAVFTLIDTTYGETDEQKIERILDNKLLEYEKKHKATIYKIYPDSLADENYEYN